MNYLTIALPYANGNLHIGHYYEAVIADIYAQHKNYKLISGDDQHGSSITLFTEKNNIDINSHLIKQHNFNIEQYKKLNVDFTTYGETHSKLHKQLVLYFYEKLLEKGFIEYKNTLSWYDVSENKFLPEKYIKGTCPSCKSETNTLICEVCNTHIPPLELIDPISLYSNTTPILKETLHAFLKTDKFYDNLKILLNQVKIPDSIKSKILEDSIKNITEIDISRDLPYFGINIPDKDLAFYVWFDAPIGYLSFILEDIMLKNPLLQFEDLVEKLKYINFEHIIGKDISFFHTFYWLNLLNILDLNLPTKIQIHGWLLTQNDKKYSKSASDSFNLMDLDDSQIDAIRLYFSSIYDSNKIADVNFELTNAYKLYNDLIVGKFVNIYSRVSKVLINNDITNINVGYNTHNYFGCNIIKGLDENNLKFVILNIDNWLNDINQYIQETQIWKLNDRIEIECIAQIVLNNFQTIRKFIELICPNLKKELSKIDFNNLQHFHLTQRIK